ncbi:HotDog domain-containing protein [Pelagophyceae sp. CCMP2097]|nr:HotDog domain-containing protein [Pelagophyceae sp. CCMP2097]|mmetsp:Transcript_11665/g.39021  ORF Transcript_11665/g.39021 Transcript_11665/m.39021 type:complete len:142 (+) Transcript_11665:80-505(+)
MRAALRVGEELLLRRAFSQTDVRQFALLTGDLNPIHDGKSAAFPKAVVHGALLASTFPAIFATHFPGAIYRSQTLTFRSAVPVDAAVLSRVSVDKVRQTRRGAFVECDTTLFLDDLERTVAVQGRATLWLPPETEDPAKDR